MHQAKQALRAKYLAIFQEREKDADQPIAAFCKKRGISPAAFYRWKNILGLSAHRASWRKKFIPVAVTSPPLLADSSRHRYEFCFPNGATLQISGCLESAELSEIIRCVGKLPS
jgi:hypothetical protein